LLGIVASALLWLLVVYLRRRSGGQAVASLMRPLRLLIAFLVTTTAGAIVILALTAVWYHNLELIALPATFAGCSLAASLETTIRGRRRSAAAVLVSVAACALAFGGLSLDHAASPESSQPLSEWIHRPRSVSAIALDEEAAKIGASRGAVTYARLGSNDDDAHAAFVEEDLKLACPVFHQYSYSSNLDQALACIRRRRPELLLVSPSFAPQHRARAQRWDAFVAAAKQLLRARYVDALTMASSQGELQVWRRR
jgi:hypothetical protein